MHVDVQLTMLRKPSKILKQTKGKRKVKIYHQQHTMEIHNYHQTILTTKVILFPILQIDHLLSKPLYHIHPKLIRHQPPFHMLSTTLMIMMLKQIHPYLIQPLHPLHMLSTTFILMLHNVNFVQELIGLHQNHHAPFVLNPILESISACQTKSIFSIDAWLKKKIIVSH